jgi:sulfite exporter TauE/SafE
MVETIAPVVHGNKSSRFFTSALLHVVGAVMSAALFGAALGGLGDLLGAPWNDTGIIVLAAIALAYALREALRLPLPVPQRRKQVPEWWRTFYSPPVAAWLYGIGLGVGFFTYVTFGTLFAVAIGAFISGDALRGLLVMAPFGLARAVAAPLIASRHRGEGTEGIDALEKVGATSVPRLINAAALLAVAVAAAALAF